MQADCQEQEGICSGRLAWKFENGGGDTQSRNNSAFVCASHVISVGIFTWVIIIKSHNYNAFVFLWDWYGQLKKKPKTDVFL